MGTKFSELAPKAPQGMICRLVVATSARNILPVTTSLRESGHNSRAPKHPLRR
jgi:hypothetical protein